MSQNKLLKSLSTAALALPGIAQAATVIDSTQIGLRHNAYQEDKFDANKLAPGSSNERYDIDINQFQLIAPLSDSLELNFSYQKEKMSGASPWYTTKIGDEVKQRMSGASGVIEDTRTDISAKLKYLVGQYIIAGKIETSNEDDYESKSVGIELGYELDDKLSAVAWSFDISDDDIMPSTTSFGTNVDVATKDSWSTHFSYSRVLQKNLQVQFGFGIIDKSGYLSDPYKWVTPDGISHPDLRKDTRPSEKRAYTLSSRMRYFLPNIDSALHLDYRLYDDDWDITSHTIDAALYKNLPNDWQVVPSIRYYSQSDAFFYENYYEQARPDGLQSTDYRLSAYGAITLGLKVNKQIANWLLTAGYQKYMSDDSYAFSDGDEPSIALVDFDMFSIGFDYKF
jgi:hypothetical protein